MASTGLSLLDCPDLAEDAERRLHWQLLAASIPRHRPQAQRLKQIKAKRKSLIYLGNVGKTAFCIALFIYVREF